MTRNVFVGFNDTPRSERALRFACSTFPDDEIAVLFVIDSHTDPTAATGWGNTTDEFEEWIDSRTEYAEDVFARASGIAGEYGVSTEPRLGFGRVNRAIVDYHDQYDPDFVVVGRHGRSRIDAVLAGDIYERLVRSSDVPAVSVRESWVERPAEGPRRVLVPFDGSPSAEIGLEWACDTFPDLDVVAMHVDSHKRGSAIRKWTDDEADRSAWVGEQRERSEEILDRARGIAERRGVQLETLTGFGPVDEVVSDYTTTERVDLIVLGVRESSGLRSYLTESLLDALIQRANAPVVEIRAGGPDE
ncbi:universal stress protein [Halorarum halophilum]|uniref:Universal stress protein n=1 Tax=Halorarum halophilum TaxID=2743090 RepID=A0A7D5GJN9_9EURY|nr:universal stress protein [Halobaculum halophilum]QLG29031.1 universal stress protein [Halobaculum halophilum]